MKFAPTAQITKWASARKKKSKSYDKKVKELISLGKSQRLKKFAVTANGIISVKILNNY